MNRSPVHTSAGGYWMLGALYFTYAAANGAWYVPLGNTLRALGYETWIPMIFSCPPVAAMLSPLITGALADFTGKVDLLLRWASGIAAFFLLCASLAMDHGMPAPLVAALFFAHSIAATPAGGLCTVAVFSRLADPAKQFGPIRVWATYGWMAAGWAVSLAIHGDASARSGYLGSALWVAVAVLTLFLKRPVKPHTVLSKKRPWREYLGFGALGLLKVEAHRGVFLASALLSIPLAAFYPYATRHLAALHVKDVTAWMTVAQLSEIIAMYSLSLLMRRFRLKWIFATGIAVGVLRFALFAFDTFPAVLLGVFLHGFCFTFYYVTTQIYIDERIDPAFRARGQALMTLLVAGLATLSGMQLTGRWFRACSLADGTVDWTRFWSALAATCLLVLTYFLVSFKGDAEQTRHRSLPSTPTEPH